MATTTHELPLDASLMHAHFSRELPPVLEVERGDSIVFPTLSSGWRWQPRRRFADPPGPDLDGGHALTGPIAVHGACAGGTLAVRVDELVPHDWGVTFPDETPYPWSIDAAAGTAADAHGAVVRLAPFLGVIGMPPPEPGPHPTGPPRRFGGNLDCKELIAGSTLFLPIPVDGALLSLGDGHAAQGDGEVSGTAIECPMARVRVTLDVHEAPPLRMPVARTPGAWVALGVDADLDVAADLAVETMLDLMERELGIERRRAFALASVVVDLRVTQVVNVVKGVHAVLRDEALGV